jgi:hypothetical protein
MSTKAVYCPYVIDYGLVALVEAFPAIHSVVFTKTKENTLTNTIAMSYKSCGFPFFFVLCVGVSV